ncbi:M-phase phosphoprotein 8 [Entomophthora muscae]|uniref:M-phase phosphoprotein 8 n=1 Tax=Entomophthora muscae TaxID=34485 RepID=A0ACC2RX72_9FUNG|nr:M-phase phosphoprotein 8 [Entomophthora muscae]
MGTCFPTRGLRQPPPIQTNRGEEQKVKYIHSNQTHYQKPQYYVKWRGYPLEESTWELLSNLTNAQEAIQLYLNKKNQKEGDPGEEGDDVNIDNSSPLETQARELDSNPGPGSLWAARSMDRWASHPCFFGIKPLQAEAPVNSQSQNTNTSPTIVVPKAEPLKLPNEGRDSTYASFMSLKSSQATNQEPTQERGTGPRPGPMTMTLKQDNQVAKLRFLTNERTPGPSTILLLSDPSTQSPRPSFPQCPDEPMENVKFGVGVLYRPKDPAL